MWQCVKCGEGIEDTFEACWNCGTTRSGAEDQTFRKADDFRADELTQLVCVPVDAPQASIPSAFPDAAAPATGRFLDPGAKTFLAAIAFAIPGVTAIFFGFGVALNPRKGPWADVLLSFGVVLLLVACAVNLVAGVWGAALFVVARRVRWWWPFSILATLAALGIGCFLAAF